MKTNYVSIDPSLAGFGIAIMDLEHKQIILDELKADSHHDFIMMSWSIINLYNDFHNKYKEYLNDTTYIAQELPISAGINSGKLNALGIYFYANLGALSAFNKIRVYHPIKLKVFHHKKKYDKKDTMLVIEDILNIFRNNGYNIDIRYSRTKKNLSITNNEADAAMYLFKTYIERLPEDKLTIELLTKYPRFNKIISLNEERGI